MINNYNNDIFSQKYRDAFEKFIHITTALVIECRHP